MLKILKKYLSLFIKICLCQNSDAYNYNYTLAFSKLVKK